MISLFIIPQYPCLILVFPAALVIDCCYYTKPFFFCNENIRFIDSFEILVVSILPYSWDRPSDALRTSLLYHALGINLPRYLPCSCQGVLKEEKGSFSIRTTNIQSSGNVSFSVSNASFIRLVILFLVCSFTK